MLDINVHSVSDFILDDLPYGIYFVDPDRKILFWNKEAERITGFLSHEVTGKHCYDNLLCHIDKNATPLCLTNCPVHATIEDGESRRAEVFLRHKEGHRISVIVNSTAVYDDDGNRLGVVETFTKNSTKFYSDDLVDSLTQLVMTDKLTGLHNRRYCENHVESKILEVRDRDKSYGIIFMDLDNFSEYNNKYGHDIGDLLLQRISEDVTSILREDDLFSRWGGEEFVGVFPVKYSSEIAIVAEKIRKTIETSCVNIEEECVSATVSIGATSIWAIDTVESAISRADALMYDSKSMGKNTVTIG